MANRPDGGRDQQRVGELEYRSCHRRRAASACGCALGGRQGTGLSRCQHVSQPREQPPRVSQLCFFSPWLYRAVPKSLCLAQQQGCGSQHRSAGQAQL